MAVRYLLLVAMLAACNRASPPDTALRAPDGSPVPDGILGQSIRRGHAILAATHDSLPQHVGSALRCLSCHLGDGRQHDALPLTGVQARFPQYRSRSATVQRLEDRINDCFQRSLSGTALAFDDPAMRDIVAYLAFISLGVPASGHVAGEGLQVGTALNGDTLAGARVFQVRCARCHGVAGGGSAVAPPVWGPRSFSIGAGMARIRRATDFIRRNMPRDSAGTLTDAEALDVAAYVTSRPRPDFVGKEHDWPRGDAPPDVPYSTLAGKRDPAGSPNRP